MHTLHFEDGLSCNSAALFWRLQLRPLFDPLLELA